MYRQSKKPQNELLGFLLGSDNQYKMYFNVDSAEHTFLEGPESTRGDGNKDIDTIGDDSGRNEFRSKSDKRYTSTRSGLRVRL